MADYTFRIPFYDLRRAELSANLLTLQGILWGINIKKTKELDMQHHDVACFDMFKRVKDFNATIVVGPNAKIVTGGSPTAKAAALFTELNGVITALNDATGGQVGGSGDQRAGTTSKAMQRESLVIMMRGLRKTAAAIAAAQNNPALLDNFRLTYGDNDQTLVANAGAFAAAAAPLQSSFVEFGHDPEFVQALRDKVAAFSAADDNQNIGSQKRSGATKTIGALIHQGLVVAKQLDAIMHNLYGSDAGKLGEWATASHIERSNHKTVAQRPAAAPQPQPAA